MSSFVTYLIGFIIIIVGLAIAAYLLNVPSMWIGVGAIILVGIGVLSATSWTKMRDQAKRTGTTTEGVERRPPTTPNA
jgi:positive regulator of sigma E activity